MPDHDDAAESAEEQQQQQPQQSTVDQATDERSESADEDGLGEKGKKALGAERDARKHAERKTAELQARLDELEQANLSDLEKAKKAAADSQAAADAAKAEMLRYRVAAKHGISETDAELFLTGTDEDTLTRQAARLAERAPTGPKPDPAQGTRNGHSTASTGEQFAAAIEKQF